MEYGDVMRIVQTSFFDDQAHKMISQDEINNILWKACDTFRGTVDPSEYKNYILVMLFLTYVSNVWHDDYEQYREQYKDDIERIQRRMTRERFVFLPQTSRSLLSACWATGHRLSVNCHYEN